MLNSLIIAPEQFTLPNSCFKLVTEYYSSCVCCSKHWFSLCQEKVLMVRKLCGHVDKRKMKNEGRLQKETTAIRVVVIRKQCHSKDNVAPNNNDQITSLR